MRKLKTTLLLSLAALAAVAFTVPAAASAAGWTYEGEPLEEEAIIGLSGKIGTNNPPGLGGNWSCNVNAEATLSPGGYGVITKFDFDLDPETCTGNGGFAGCVATEATTTVPWNVEATEAAAIYVPEPFFDVYLEAGSCVAAAWSPMSNRSPVSLTPDNSSAMSSLSFKALEGWATGEFDVTPAGVYGISGQ